MLNVSSKPAPPAAQPPAVSLLDKQPTPTYKWGVFPAVLVILVSFALLPLIAQITINYVPSILGWDSRRASQWSSHSALANFLYVLMAEALTSGFLAWFIYKKKASFWRVVALRRPQWLDVGYALLGALCYVGIFIVLVQVISAILPLDATKQQAIGFDKHSGGIDLLLAFVSLAILPPIVEEMVFRGFFYGTLRARNIGAGLSILITSLVFGTLHLFGAGDGSLLWIAFIDTFVLSLVLCYIREKTGSIWATMLLHALKNGFVFVNLFILGAR